MARSSPGCRVVRGPVGVSIRPDTGGLSVRIVSYKPADGAFLLFHRVRLLKRPRVGIAVALGTPRSAFPTRGALGATGIAIMHHYGPNDSNLLDTMVNSGCNKRLRHPCVLAGTRGMWFVSCGVVVTVGRCRVEFRERNHGGLFGA